MLAALGPVPDPAREEEEGEAKEVGAGAEEGRETRGAVAIGLIAESEHLRSLRMPWPVTQAREGSRGLKEQWWRGRVLEGLEARMEPTCLPFSHSQHTSVQSGAAPWANKNLESAENATLDRYIKKKIIR